MAKRGTTVRRVLYVYIYIERERDLYIYIYMYSLGLPRYLGETKSVGRMDAFFICFVCFCILVV